jgi:hypothetical protein
LSIDLPQSMNTPPQRFEDTQRLYQPGAALDATSVPQRTLRDRTRQAYSRVVKLAEEYALARRRGSSLYEGSSRRRRGERAHLAVRLPARHGHESRSLFGQAETPSGTPRTEDGNSWIDHGIGPGAQLGLLAFRRFFARLQGLFR